MISPDARYEGIAGTAGNKSLSIPDHDSIIMVTACKVKYVTSKVAHRGAQEYVQFIQFLSPENVKE